MTHTKLRSFLVTLLLPICFSASAEKSLNLSTWNIEWLSSSPSDKFPQSHRAPEDYATLSNYFAVMGTDVLAFQEVNDKKALMKVIGNDYKIYFSDRSQPSNRHHQFEEINQYTGFAVRSGIELINQRDLVLDTSRSSKLRFATYVVLKPIGRKPIHMLSVHLKARCSGAFKSTRDCKILKQQGVELNNWMQQREQGKQDYIILGDFNHNLGYEKDWLWKSIANKTSAVLATRKTKAECKVRSRNNPNKTHRFRSLIDHVIVSEQIDLSKPKQTVFETKDVLHYTLSDHCPISTTLH